MTVATTKRPTDGSTNAVKPYRFDAAFHKVAGSYWYFVKADGRWHFVVSDSLAKDSIIHEMMDRVFGAMRVQGLVPHRLNGDLPAVARALVRQHGNTLATYRMMPILDMTRVAVAAGVEG